MRPADGVIFSDLVDDLLEHRKVIRRPLGKTAALVITRLKEQHGMEPAAALTEAFWRRHALSRMSGVKSIAGGAPVTSQTAAQDLLYASVVLRHAADSGINVPSKTRPGKAHARSCGTTTTFASPPARAPAGSATMS